MIFEKIYQQYSWFSSKQRSLTEIQWRCVSPTLRERCFRTPVLQGLAPINPSVSLIFSPEVNLALRSRWWSGSDLLGRYLIETCCNTSNVGIYGLKLNTSILISCYYELTFGYIWCKVNPVCMLVNYTSYVHHSGHTYHTESSRFSWTIFQGQVFAASAACFLGPWPGKLLEDIYTYTYKVVPPQL